MKKIKVKQMVSYSVNLDIESLVNLASFPISEINLDLESIKSFFCKPLKITRIYFLIFVVF